MKYKTVVIDPPWPIRACLRGGSVPQSMQGSTLKSDLPYNTMSIEEIENFPINDFAAKEALLFLWVTAGKADTGKPIIEIGLNLLECWGFIYHTILTWQKTNPYSFWSPYLWTTEHVLFAYRGNFRELTNNTFAKWKSLFTAPTTTHSTKPAFFYRTLLGWTPRPRIDLFARNWQAGFDGWGKEYVGDGPLTPFLEQAAEEADPAA